MTQERKPLTVEQGRAMQARARRYQLVERIALVAAGLGIPLFAVSIFELTRLEDAARAGAEMGVPYLAYTAIAMFLGGTGLVFLMRHLVANVSRALAAEQKRRWVEGDAPVATDEARAEGDAPLAADEARAEDDARAQDDTPAMAG